MIISEKNTEYIVISFLNKELHFQFIRPPKSTMGNINSLAGNHGSWNQGSKADDNLKVTYNIQS